MATLGESARRAGRGADRPGRPPLQPPCHHAGDRRESEIGQVDLVDEPVAASYLVAAGLQVDLPDKQNLLAIPSVSERPRNEGALLRRELSLLEQLGIAGPARLTVSLSLK